MKSNLSFRLMALQFKLRDLFLSRSKVLAEVGIRPGFTVLDYGCGPGSYVLPVWKLIGESGKLYALDMHLLAVATVRRLVARKELANVETIHSVGRTRLPDNSVDVVLLYDTFHAVRDRHGVLSELHRVLKPEGILSFSDHHMAGHEIASALTDGNLFRLASRGERTYGFAKVQ